MLDLVIKINHIHYFSAATVEKKKVINYMHYSDQISITYHIETTFTKLILSLYTQICIISLIWGGYFKLRIE